MTQTRTVDQAMQQAAESWRAGDRAAALQCLDQVLQADPEHASALNLKGCAAFEAGQIAQAKALFERAARRSPDDPAIQGNLARAEFQLGQVEPARRRAHYLAAHAPQAQSLCDEFETALRNAKRPSAIAGSFYEADAQHLRRQVEGFLQAAVPASTSQPKVLVVPHAGHIYSGRTAGRAYALLRPYAATIRRVVLLGPAHRVYVKGVALPGAGSFATPLGVVPLDLLGADAIADLPFVSVRPDVHGPEHSLEVQLPFLQCVLGRFELLPLVVGDVDAATLTQLLQRLWGGAETLIVISTDLSHFHAYGEANAIDQASCVQVLAFDARLSHEQACGATPLNALLQVAAARHLRIEQVERCNSGDTAGDRQRVVGYASFALYEQDAPELIAKTKEGAGTPATFDSKLSLEDGRRLLRMARRSLHRATGAAAGGSEPDMQGLERPGASFVTLTEANGQLRGCIGSLQAWRPLAQDVQANALAAALKDPRFAPVTAAEAPTLHVEVSVLGEAQPMHFANQSHALWQLRPGIDGVILEFEDQGRGYRSTFLPQVWEQLPDPRVFMAQLKVKAGLPFDFWSPQLRISRYQVQKFEEQEAAP